MSWVCFSSPERWKSVLTRLSATPDSSALSTASCKLSHDCAWHGVDTENKNNNNAKMLNPRPKIVAVVFTYLLSLCAQIIHAARGENM
jgi:hypothetical protein